MFKRLKTWFERNRSTQKNIPVRMLDTQYRMHKEICSFPSQYFYNGMVKTAPSVESRKQLPFQPYIILEHECTQDSSGYSIVEIIFLLKTNVLNYFSEMNIGEAYMIVNLVEMLMSSECKSLDISILTPYHKQREQLALLLKNK